MIILFESGRKASKKTFVLFGKLFSTTRIQMYKQFTVLQHFYFQNFIKNIHFLSTGDFLSFFFTKKNERFFLLYKQEF